MANTIKTELQNYCDGIAKELINLYNAAPTDEERERAEAEGEACDLWGYFGDVLDVEYTISARGVFLGARVAVTLGGPNVYVDTRNGEVNGYWGSDSATAFLPYDVRDAINDIFAELYDSMR